MMPRWEFILLTLLLMAAWATADTCSYEKNTQEIAKVKTASPENKGETLDILSLQAAGCMAEACHYNCINSVLRHRCQITDDLAWQCTGRRQG